MKTLKKTFVFIPELKKQIDFFGLYFFEVTFSLVVYITISKTSKTFLSTTSFKFHHRKKHLKKEKHLFTSFKFKSKEKKILKMKRSFLNWHYINQNLIKHNDKILE
jgi:hypothetical protein